jgi:hypothetical protein
MTTKTAPLTPQQAEIMSAAVLKAEFDSSAAIQSEFGSYERFAAYRRAEKEGRAKIVGRSAKR